jgi:hypothetical protein
MGVELGLSYLGNNRLRVFLNRLLRRIFETKGKEVIGD